jgi:hypothetical protein
VPTPDPSRRPPPRAIDPNAAEILTILDELDARSADFARALDALAANHAAAVEHATEQQRGGDRAHAAEAVPGPSGPIPAPPARSSPESEPSAPPSVDELFHVEQLHQPPTTGDAYAAARPHRDTSPRRDPGSLLAHELANLSGAIAGRAQRALRTSDPDHARAALELASDLGSQLTLLCELFMAGHAAGTPPLDHTGIRRCHESARSQLADHHLAPEAEWTESLDPRARCPLPPALLTRVLVNLAANALDAIARRRAHEPGCSARIRVGSRVLCGGVGVNCSTWNNCAHCTSACARGGRMVEVWVEDSGAGFEGAKYLSNKKIKEICGHGLGLGVCARIAEGWGGAMVFGGSDLGGARVGVRFVQEPMGTM